MRFRIILIGVVLSIGMIFGKPAVYAAEIEFDEETFGQVDQSIGVVVSSLNAQTVSDLKSTFPSGGVYIKLVNPTTSAFQTDPAQELTQAGFSWYLLFPATSSATSFLPEYASLHPLDRLVVETGEVDSEALGNIDVNYPAVRVHVGNLPVWPRDQVKSILEQVQPPVIEGVSFWMGEVIDTGSVWSDVKLTFDTFYDASKDISGGSGVDINYPAGTVLSVSDVRNLPYRDVRKSAYLSGLISSAIVSSVQSQGNSGQAPIRYVIPGVYQEFSESEKTLISHYSRFMLLQPDLVWPHAIGQNGDPWDNSFLSNSNTKPIVGVIGQTDQGYYGFFTNTENSSEEVDFGDRLDLSDYTAYSTERGSISVSGFEMILEAYETVVLYPSSLSGTIPNPGGGADPAPTQPPTTTDPSLSSCPEKQAQGDYNCDDVTDEKDYSNWLTDFEKGDATLASFEYWRRVRY